VKTLFAYLSNGVAFIGGMCIALIGFGSWVHTIYLLQNPTTLVSTEDSKIPFLLLGDFSFVMLIVFYILSWKNQRGVQS
jgi:xanthine/uracil/vitamin C permease (AzgA family)